LVAACNTILILARYIFILHIQKDIIHQFKRNLKKSTNQKGTKKELASFVGWGSFCGNVFSAIGSVWMK